MNIGPPSMIIRTKFRKMGKNNYGISDASVQLLIGIYVYTYTMIGTIYYLADSTCPPRIIKLLYSNMIKNLGVYKV